MVSDDERSNTYRERVEYLDAFSKQKELPEASVGDPFGLLRHISQCTIAADLLPDCQQVPFETHI